MIFTSVLLAVSQSTYILTAIGAAFGGALIGFLFKQALLAKKNKRVLTLEDEMLSNHRRILSLEREIARLEGEKNNLASGEKKISDVKRKVS